MADMIRCISPVDGSVYAERTGAASNKDVTTRCRMARATRRTAGSAVPVEERAAYCLRAVDAMLAMKRRDRARTRLADGPAGALRRRRAARLRGARPPHDRDRRGGAGAGRCRAEGRLLPLDHARAAGRGVRHRAVELPVSHGGQLGRPGADGRQRRDAEARGADAAGRRALPQGLRRGRAARGRVPDPRADPRPDGRKHLAGVSTRSTSPVRSPAAGPWRAAAGTFIDVGLELGGKDPAYVRADCRPSACRSKTSSTARSSIPASRAAASSASMSTRRCTKPFVEGFVDLTRKLRARHAARRSDDARPDGKAGSRRFRPRADPPGGARGREGAHRPEGVRRWTERARPTWPRRCSPASTTRCR